MSSYSKKLTFNVRNEMLDEEKVRAFWIPGAIVCGLVLAMPLFSAVRGFSQPLGRGLMAATDLAVLLLFLWAVLSPGLRGLKLAIFAMLALSVLNVGFWTSQVPADAIYQGFRKSMLWLLAICVGYSIRPKDRNIVVWSILIGLTFICAYAIKQWLFGFASFDYRLLDLQAAMEYSNKIGGRQRAISVLSSGFHVGMAGAFLILIGLCWKTRGFWAIFVALTLVLVGFLAVYASYTRTFMIIAVALSCLQISRYAKSSLARVALFVCVGVLLVIGMFGDYFSFIGSALMSDNRFTSRSISYEMMYDHFTSHPIGLFSGFGLGSAGSTLGLPFMSRNAIWVEPHNTLLKYVFEFGFLVSLWLFWEIFVLLRKSRIPHNSMNFATSLSPLLVALIVGSGLTITSVETWPVSLYIGFVVGMFAARPHTAGLVQR